MLSGFLTHNRRFGGVGASEQARRFLLATCTALAQSAGGAPHLAPLVARQLLAPAPPDARLALCGLLCALSEQLAAEVGGPSTSPPTTAPPAPHSKARLHASGRCHQTCTHTTHMFFPARTQHTCFSLQVGGLARGMNAMSASRLDEYDFDARLEAYNTASKAPPCPLPPSPAVFLRTKAASPALLSP